MSNGAPTYGDAGAGVLICDDNDAMRTLLGAIVGTSLGMRVVGEATDGNEAVVQATRLQPNVILLDLAMPIRSALEALPELRLVAPDARIIVISGFAASIAGEQVIALGGGGLPRKGRRPRHDRRNHRARPREYERLAEKLDHARVTFLGTVGDPTL